jgi:lysophospholipase L1-like esterase
MGFIYNAATFNQPQIKRTSMSKKVMSKILVCAILFAAALRVGQAQTNVPPANPPTQGGSGRVRGPQPVPGPPAFVPPEVVMPRPTADEVAKMNADLQQFVATSADKELFQTYEPQLAVQMPRDNMAIRPVGGGVRGPRHQKFVDIASINDFDILFEGDSITDWWQLRPPQGGSEVFQNYFGNLKVANFAVAGDTTQGLLWGLQNGEGQGHKPKVIMLMIGTNNSGNNSGPEIAECVGADVAELRKDFLDAKILLLAIFPRGAGPSDPNRVKNEAANKIIAKLDDGKHVFFMNINDKFLDADGKLIGFRPDNLHPVAQGYEAWAAAVAPTLKSLMN